MNNQKEHAHLQEKLGRDQMTTDHNHAQILRHLPRQSLHPQTLLLPPAYLRSQG